MGITYTSDTINPTPPRPILREHSWSLAHPLLASQRTWQSDGAASWSVPSSGLPFL